MKIQIRSDRVIVEGYVNAVERDSKTLRDRAGAFIERICKGAFGRAIERNSNIRVLLNHDHSRDLGGTADGTLKLTEDAIGLRACATIYDDEVIREAKAGDLVGWSFGFYDIDVDERFVDGVKHRAVKDMDLREVSILDRRKTPAYDGTLIAARDDEQPMNAGEAYVGDVEIIDEEIEERDDEPKEETPAEEPKKEIDYSEYDKMLAEMKGENLS